MSNVLILLFPKTIPCVTFYLLSIITEKVFNLESFWRMSNGVGGMTGLVLEGRTPLPLLPWKGRVSWNREK